MKLKRLLTLVLTLLAVCCLSFACGDNGNGGNNAKTDDQGLIYTLNDNQDGYIVSAGKLVDFDLEDELFDIYIPAEFDGLPVLEIKDSAFKGQINVTYIDIPDSIEKIGVDAFDRCLALEYSEHDGAKYLGNGDNPYMVLATYKDAKAEYNVHNDTKIILDKAFAGNEDIKKINLPNGLMAIGEQAFSGCSKLTEITLPGSLSVIADSTFNGAGLKTVTLLDGIERIEAQAFNGCTSLTNISIPDSVYFVGDNAFNRCSKLSFNTENGLNYLGNSSNKYVILFKADKTLTNCTVNDNTKIIYKEAFMDCTKLTSVTLPAEGVISIGDSAFKNCQSLTSVVLPNYLESIGNEVFANCNFLYSVEMGEVNVDYGTTVGKNLFDGCNRLADVWDYSEILTEDAIGKCSIINLYSDENGYGEINTDDEGFVTYDYDGEVYLLNYLGSEIEVYIPDGVTIINQYAFQFSTADSNTANDGIANIEVIYIADSVTTIGKSAFTALPSLYAVLTGESVETIEDFAFNGCENLLTVYLGENVEKIEDSAFFGCYRLVEVINTSDLSVKAGKDNNGYVGYYAIHVTDNPDECGELIFDGYNGFVLYATDLEYGPYYLVNYLGTESEIVVPEDVTVINQYAFLNNTTITDVVITEWTEEIGNDAFFGCTSLKSIELPFVGAKANATEASEETLFGYIFGSISFESATSVQQSYSGGDSVTYFIPSSLENVTVNGDILYGAFYNCKNLKTVTIGENVTSIGDNAFYGCTGIKEVIYNNQEVENTWEVKNFANEYSNPLRFGGTLTVNGTTLTEVVINNDVNAYAYYMCAWLTKVTFTENVYYVGKSAFEYCTALDTVEFLGDINYWAQIEFVNYASNPFAYADTLLVNGAVTTNVKIIVPDDEYVGNDISAYAFYKCNWLNEIEINDSITEIGTYAFAHCASLEFVTVGTSVNSIGDFAFFNAVNMLDVYNYSSLELVQGSRDFGYIAYYAEYVGNN